MTIAMSTASGMRQPANGLELQYRLNIAYQSITFKDQKELLCVYMKSSDAKASKCRLKFSSKISIFISLLCVGSVISL